MLIKILGLTDLIVAIAFLINNNLDKSNWFPNNILLVLGIYLLVKGIFFLLLLDFASAIDVICGIIILVSFAVHINLIIAAVVFIFIAQKSFFSLIS